MIFGQCEAIVSLQQLDCCGFWPSWRPQRPDKECNTQIWLSPSYLKQNSNQRRVHGAATPHHTGCQVYCAGCRTKCLCRSPKLLPWLGKHNIAICIAWVCYQTMAVHPQRSQTQKICYMGQTIHTQFSTSRDAEALNFMGDCTTRVPSSSRVSTNTTAMASEDSGQKPSSSNGSLLSRAARSWSNSPWHVWSDSSSLCAKNW